MVSKLNILATHDLESGRMMGEIFNSLSGLVSHPSLSSTTEVPTPESMVVEKNNFSLSKKYHILQNENFIKSF